MEDAKGCRTPMEVNHAHETRVSDDPVTSFPYREAIGCLMYLMVCTRPDIDFSVGKLAQFCESPLPEHVAAVQRLLRYIKLTISNDILYYDPVELTTSGFSDSDWGGCRDTRKSTEGFVFLYGGGAVSWRSKKQSIVDTSSCKAEYVAAFSATKESIWLSNLLAEMTGSEHTTPQTLFVDNQRAIALAERQATTSRSKHIEIRFHYLRDAVAKNLVKL